MSGTEHENLICSHEIPYLDIVWTVDIWLAVLCMCLLLVHPILWHAGDGAGWGCEENRRMMLSAFSESLLEAGGSLPAAGAVPCGGSGMAPGTAAGVAVCTVGPPGKPSCT